VASIAESSFFKLVYRTLSSSGSAADVIVGDLEIVGLVRKRRSWSGWRDLSNVAGRGPLVMGSKGQGAASGQCSSNIVGGMTKQHDEGERRIPPVLKWFPLPVYLLPCFFVTTLPFAGPNK